MEDLKEEASEALQIQEEAIKSQIRTVRELDSVPVSHEGGSTGLWAVVGDAFGFVAPDELDDAQDADSSIDQKFDDSFLVADHSLHPQWAQFKASQQPPIQDAHKQAIKANDESLQALYSETVPEMLTDDQFWRAWLFHQFLKKAQNPRPIQKPKVTIEWDTWDNEELTTPNTRDLGGLGAGKEGNDWEEWD
jgi:hypothetical protein